MLEEECLWRLRQRGAGDLRYKLCDLIPQFAKLFNADRWLRVLLVQCAGADPQERQNIFIYRCEKVLKRPVEIEPDERLEQLWNPSDEIVGIEAIQRLCLCPHIVRTTGNLPDLL